MNKGLIEYNIKVFTFTAPALGADLRAALVASCLRGALPPVDLRAVCLVLAIFNKIDVIN
jgi:hypothetical protein